MRYSLFLYSNEEAFKDAPPEAMEESLAAFGAYIGALREAGVFVDTDWLQPTATATTLSAENGETRIQDGPFAETKEQLGGFFVIDVPDLDTAINWAKQCPAIHYGKIEVRPSAMPEEEQGRHG
ncbi:MAG: YciI family protein [Pseudomonadota bacterium]